MTFLRLTGAEPDGLRLCEGSKCSDCEPLDHLGSTLAAMQWLQSRNIEAAMGSLRHLLLDFNLPVQRLDDRRVLEQISLLVGSGRLHICREAIEKVAVRAGSSSRAAVPEAPPFPLSTSRERPKPNLGPVEEAPMFASAVDPRALQETMSEAARLGVPFCEECAKAHM